MSAFVVFYGENQNLVIRKEDLDAFQWINNNVPVGQRFLIITGVKPLEDPTSEWIPAPTSQTSLSIVQGREWLAKEDFYAILKKSSYLQLCPLQDFTCVDKWKQGSEASFDFVYFRKLQIQDQYGTKYIEWPLEQSMMETELYQKIYEAEYTDILQVKK